MRQQKETLSASPGLSVQANKDIFAELKCNEIICDERGFMLWLKQLTQQQLLEKQMHVSALAQAAFC